MISSFYLKWTEFTRNFEFSLGPRGPIIETKFTISWKFGPIQVKLWQHMFSSMKMEEYMESELFCIFWAKLVGKNIVLGFPGTQRRAASAAWCLFLNKYTNFLNQTVTPYCFPCEVMYTNFVYVKEKPFCPFNLAFSFVGPRGPISCSNISCIWGLKALHCWHG